MAPQVCYLLEFYGDPAGSAGCSIKFHLPDSDGQVEVEKGQKMQLIRNFLSDDSGATAIEYGLIAAGIALAIIVAVNTLGNTISNEFNTIGSSLK